MPEIIRPVLKADDQILIRSLDRACPKCGASRGEMCSEEGNCIERTAGNDEVDPNYGQIP